MHIEWDTTRVEAYITAHRARVAVIGFIILTATFSLGWALILPVLGIVSAHLVIASTVLIAIGSAITALAWYWGE